MAARSHVTQVSFLRGRRKNAHIQQRRPLLDAPASLGRRQRGHSSLRDFQTVRCSLPAHAGVLWLSLSFSLDRKSFVALGATGCGKWLTQKNSTSADGRSKTFSVSLWLTGANNRGAS